MTSCRRTTEASWQRSTEASFSVSFLRHTCDVGGMNMKTSPRRCDDVALHGVLEFVPDFYKTQKMCNKAVDTYPSAIQLVTDQHKTQEICVKAVDTCPFAFDSIPD